MSRLLMVKRWSLAVFTVSRFAPFCALALSAAAQTYDLPSQIRLIQELMPGATRCAVFYNPQNANLDEELARVTQETGIMVVKTPVSSVREISAALRNIQQYAVNFIYLLEDRIVTGSTGTRFVTKPSTKDKIPVFTTDPDSFKNDVFGQLFRGGSRWFIRINGRVVDKFDLQVPRDNDKFIVEQGGGPN